MKERDGRIERRAFTGESSHELTLQAATFAVTGREIIRRRRIATDCP
jgi:hypothetical protein